MKKLPLSLLFSLLVISGSFGFPNIKGKAHPGAAVRNLSGFEGISLSIPAKLDISPGDFHVEINCSNALLQEIKTDVKNGVLNIKFINNFQSHINESITIHITLPAINKLELNGSGSISSTGLFKGEHLKLEVNGSGKIEPGDINFNELNAVVNGSGVIENLSGSGSNGSFEINGSGKINAEAFKTNNANATVTGSGNIRLNAIELLNAQVIGSGIIGYKGSPSKKNTQISGSGKVAAL